MVLMYLKSMIVNHRKFTVGVIVFFSLVFAAGAWPAVAVSAIARGILTIQGLYIYSKGESECGPVDSVKGTIQSAKLYGRVGELRHNSRLLKRENNLELWSTEHGNYWIVNSIDMDEFYGMLAEQEINIYGSRPNGVRRGDIVLDCGACIGIYTRRALLDGARLVVAIEPAPDNVECLKRNLSKEIADKRVIVISKGVWDKEGTLDLHLNPGKSWGDSFVATNDSASVSVRVPLTTIDRLAGELLLPAINVIKMDIEGSERQALAGARAVISKFKPRLAICLYHLEGDRKFIPAFVLGIDSSYRKQYGWCRNRNDQMLPDTAIFY